MTPASSQCHGRQAAAALRAGGTGYQWKRGGEWLHRRPRGGRARAGTTPWSCKRHRRSWCRVAEVTAFSPCPPFPNPASVTAPPRVSSASAAASMRPRGGCGGGAGAGGGAWHPPRRGRQASASVTATDGRQCPRLRPPRPQAHVGAPPPLASARPQTRAREVHSCYFPLPPLSTRRAPPPTLSLASSMAGASCRADAGGPKPFAAAAAADDAHSSSAGAARAGRDRWPPPPRRGVHGHCTCSSTMTSS